MFCSIQFVLIITENPTQKSFMGDVEHNKKAVPSTIESFQFNVTWHGFLYQYVQALLAIVFHGFQPRFPAFHMCISIYYMLLSHNTTTTHFNTLT